MSATWTVLIGVLLLAVGGWMGWLVARRGAASRPQPVASATPARPLPPVVEPPAAAPTPDAVDEGATKPTIIPQQASEPEYDPDLEDEDDLPTTLHVRHDDPEEDALAEVDTGFYEAR